MTLIDGDKIITAQLYDDEYEEFKEKQMSIIDYVNTYTTEGITVADDILDKIRTEIEQLPIQYLTHDCKICIDSQAVLDILDKYKTESEEV